MLMGMGLLMAEDRLDEHFAGYGPTLTTKELGEILGVSEPTVRRWLAQGVVPAYKIGTSWVTYRDEVRDWLREQRNQ